MEQIYDLIVIGNGPAGLSAAISAGRAGLSVLVIADNGEAGGNLKGEREVAAYPGFPSISGAELSSMLFEHAQVSGAEFAQDEITGIRLKENIKTVLSKKKEYAASGVIIASGAGSDYVHTENYLNKDETGRILAGEDCRTNILQVYAAGNARRKPFSELISALSDGAAAVSSFLDDIN